MKTLLTVIAFFFITHAFAQQGYDDVVYLKNGTVIHGIIVEQVPNQSIKIQTKDKNIFVFKMDEIEKITNEQRGIKKYDEPGRIVPDDDFTGYSLIIESHIGPGISSESINSMTMSGQAVNGIQINGICFLGAGAGFDLHNETNGGGNFFMAKFFIDARLFPVKKDISPLFILSSGYSFDMNENIYGGFLFNSGAGIKYKLQKKLALNITLNYKYQNMTFTDNGFPHNPSIDASYGLHYIVLNLGVSF